MSALCKTNQSLAQLRLSAVLAQSGAIIHKNIRWEMFHQGQCVAQSHEPAPTFSLKSANYDLVVHYKSTKTKVNNINLLPYSIQDQVVRIGQVRTPDSYHIDDSESFNPETEHERRKHDRDAQRHVAGHDDILKKPPSEEALRQQQQALQHANLGPQAHPILSIQAQFDGAVEPDVNPLPTENPDTVNELYERYEHQLTNQPKFNPQPSTPGHGG
jgi:hypothetical protein